MSPPDEPAAPRGEHAQRPSGAPLHAGPMTALPMRVAGTPQPPARLPRGSAGLHEPPPGRLRQPLPGRARQPARRPGMPSTPVRAVGPTADELADGAPIRTLIFAPEPTRAAWIEQELSRAPATVLEREDARPRITIQLGRRVRTVVFALLKDPPPRPHVLIVDFDAVSPGELFELHAIRHDGWTGRLIGLGAVPDELVTSLEIDHVFPAPFVRDSLLDCVAGTRHAAITVTIPVIAGGTVPP